MAGEVAVEEEEEKAREPEEFRGREIEGRDAEAVGER